MSKNNRFDIGDSNCDGPVVKKAKNPEQIMRIAFAKLITSNSWIKNDTNQFVGSGKILCIPCNLDIKIGSVE